MNPAFSVIFFTTASGAGYGMLLWLGLLTPFGMLPNSPWFGAIAMFVALVLISAGLLSSTFHLGRPERAWRAVSQWRTSWLSREGIAALITYVPAVLCGLAWWFIGPANAVTLILGLLAAAMAVVTVLCTGMIYASLKPIRQWHNSYVLPFYLMCAAFSGGACLAAIAWIWRPTLVLVIATMLFGLAALVVKFAYWRDIDNRRGVSTAETATGLGNFGQVRMLDAPHTEENYLLREMGYRVGRKHARTLRGVALVVGFAVPVALLSMIPPLAAIAALFGIYVERWLFFAEATHTVTLYYGRAA